MIFANQIILVQNGEFSIRNNSIFHLMLMLISGENVRWDYKSKFPLE